MHTLPKNHKQLAMIIAAERGAAMQQRTELLADIIGLAESMKLPESNLKVIIGYNEALDDIIKEIKKL